jgi:nicotinamidase-related amidase
MRRGLAPRPSTKGRVALLVLDLITDFEFPDGLRVRRELHMREPAIRTLLARARRQRVPVIYVNDNLGRWRSDSRALLAHCTEEHRPGATLVRSLAPQASDYIVLKPRHSAFFGTPLAALLDELRVDTLLLAGISAESCVWMTACDAHTHGFRLIVPADSIAGASARARRAMLENLRNVLNAKAPRSAKRIRLGSAGA